MSSPSMLAIDFGTSNSLLVAASADKVSDPIPLDPFASDPTIFRTLLYFPSMNKVHYGADAIQSFIKNQSDGRLIRSIKKQLPVRSFIGTWIEDRPLNLEDLIALFLKEMRTRASNHFGIEFESAVIGRPARFALDDGDDRFAQFRLEEAAKRAGFKHIEFCPEPLAAAYEFRSQVADTKTVLVADFGGGTSDFTVIRIGKKHFDPKDVLAMGGIPTAGDALDGAVMRKQISPLFGADVEYKVPFGSNVMKMPSHLVGKICSPADISFLAIQDAKEFLKQIRQWALTEADKEKMDRLLVLINDKVGFHVFEKIEGAKRVLSEADTARVIVDYPGIEFEKDVAKKAFVESTTPQIEAILKTLDETVAAAGLKPEQIDLVCCTGGTARVPALYQGMAQRFGEAKLQRHEFFHSVVKGLGLRAQELIRHKA